MGTGDIGTGNVDAGEIGEYGNQHLNSSLHNRIDSAFKPAAKSKDSPYLRSQNDNQTNVATEFYTLDEALPEEVKVNDTLYDTDQVQEFPRELVNGKNADGDGSYSVWSQEPTLVAMRNEITNLRGMLEQQLTGLAWNDLKKNNPLRAKLIKQLLELGFGPGLADQVIQSAEGQSDDYRKAWQMTLSSLAEKLPIQDDDVALSGGVVALVGATGVGKTTTIAKLAARYALRHGRNSIVLITTDTYRIGALEQLRTYGRILGIPVKIAHNKKQLQDLLKMLSEKKLVLIDTAGMGQRDIRLMEQFSVINDCAMGLKTLLVLSSTTHRAALDETVRSFSNVKSMVVFLPSWMKRRT
jgi:flagellar biosynthetic protein FlhF